MQIKEVSANIINDSRDEKTIQVTLKTNVGVFKASAPTGKSTGKFEVKPYRKDINEDITALKSYSDYFSKENIDDFDDLRRIEDIVDRQIGANTLFALEAASLKAIAREKNKEVWQLINEKSKSLPRLVGKVVGGGKHSSLNKKPDFQEFLIIPRTKTIKEASEISKKIKKQLEQDLKLEDEKFKSKLDDENGWASSLNEKEILEIIKKYDVDIGLDIAASSFYKRKKYHYENPMLKRTVDEQYSYLDNLIKNFDLVYVEDPFEEEDFESFAKLMKKFPKSLIVGDDLIVTNSKRLEKAINEKSVNAIIVKPNQCGSLLEVKKVCEMAKKKDIKLVFSHRSGETEENILADLAFGFGADFLKIGIDGKERISKVNRLIEIEKGLK